MKYCPKANPMSPAPDKQLFPKSERFGIRLSFCQQTCGMGTVCMAEVLMPAIVSKLLPLSGILSKQGAISLGWIPHSQGL